MIALHTKCYLLGNKHAIENRLYSYKSGGYLYLYAPKVCKLEIVCMILWHNLFYEVVGQVKVKQT